MGANPLKNAFEETKRMNSIEYEQRSKKMVR